MLQFGILTKLVRLTKIIMADSAFHVQIQSELTETVSTNKGLKNGDGLAPLLFNTALESAIRNLAIDTHGTFIHKSVQVTAGAFLVY
jgi:sorting nexin-29